MELDGQHNGDDAMYFFRRYSQMAQLLQRMVGAGIDEYWKDAIVSVLQGGPAPNAHPDDARLVLRHLDWMRTRNLPEEKQKAPPADTWVRPVHIAAMTAAEATRLLLTEPDQDVVRYATRLYQTFGVPIQFPGGQ